MRYRIGIVTLLLVAVVVWLYVFSILRERQHAATVRAHIVIMCKLQTGVSCDPDIIERDYWPEAEFCTTATETSTEDSYTYCMRALNVPLN